MSGFDFVDLLANPTSMTESPQPIVLFQIPSCISPAYHWLFSTEDVQRTAAADCLESLTSRQLFQEPVANEAFADCCRSGLWLRHGFS